ncbi:MAG: alpha/beta hydrolase [Chloroflexi bacterium]|nr:alpha/beta hydrolase [Chloroflexota bacterium]MCC6894107.1 alpha/beta fold hydrolase [Anaerolineae bacterium]
MPKLRVNGVELYYEDTGGVDKEIIIFSHALWLNSRMFDAQIAAFSNRYRCITYDHRGQGQSEVTPSGYDMETLYEDAANLIQSLNAIPCHFVGVGLGGYIGMRLASRRPQLLRSLTLVETSADREPDYAIRQQKFTAQILRWLGARWVVEPTISHLFGQHFLSKPANKPQIEGYKRQLARVDRAGMSNALGGVMDRRGVYEELENIQTPTLVLVGDEDIAAMSEKSNRLTSRIANSKSAVVAGAGRSPTIEQPDMVNNLLSIFLNKIKATSTL